MYEPFVTYKQSKIRFVDIIFYTDKDNHCLRLVIITSRNKMQFKNY